MTDQRQELSAGSQWLTSTALVVSLGIVAARCTMPEILRDPFEAAPGIDLGARGAGPATTVFLNTLSFLPPLLVLLASWLDDAFRLRRAWSHLLLALLALVALTSWTWSSDAFAAAVSAGNLLSAGLLGWTAVQAVRSWKQFRVVTGLAAGVVLVLVVHSVVYVTLDAPEMQRLWAEQREVLLRQRNFAPDSFQAQLFEKKVAGGELMGFYNSPNTLAAVAVIGLVILLGSMLDRLRLRDPAGWLAPSILLLVGAGWMLYATGSRTSLATPVLAIGLLAVTPLLARWNQRRPARVFWIAVALVGLGAALVVAHGLFHGSLVERSLTFRWHYWTAAWRMFCEHPLAGVGWSNFGQWYSSLKLPFAPEDVKDPHNLAVRFASELGIFAALLCIIWLLRSAWELTRPLPGRELELPREVVSDPVPVIRPVALPALLATLLVLAFSVDYSQMVAFWAIETLRRLMYGCLLLGGALLVGLKSVEHPAADDRPGPWLLSATAVALAVFLLHNAIDFSFFEAGPMSLALVLLGAAAGMRQAQWEDQESPQTDTPAARRLRWLILPLLLLALAYAGGIALPVVAAEHLATQADAQLTRGESYAAAQQYEEAFETAPHLRNADYLVRGARATALANRPPQAALALLDRALAANPRLVSAWNMKAQVLEAMRQDGTPARLRALELDPANVSLRLSLAEVLEATGKSAAAREQYRLALQYNDLLPQGEIRRLPATREAALRKRLEQQ